MAQIQTLNLATLGKMNQAVGLYASNSQDAITTMITTEWMIAVIFLFLSSFIAFIIIKSIQGPIKEMVVVSEAIAQGDMSSDALDTSRLDEIGQLMSSLEQMKSNLHEQFTEVARLWSMIESQTSNIMMCDIDFNITYCNPASIRLMNKHLRVLQQQFPHLKPDALVGASIDTFHMNPQANRQMLLNTSNLPFTTEIQVAGLTFGLNISALYDKEGNQIGNGVEWIDYNDRESYRKEMDGILDASNTGDLQHRGVPLPIFPKFISQ